MIIGTEVIRFSELPSTNSYCAKLLREGTPEEGTLVITDFQTAGRGQKGNTWESQAGRNLLLSVILYPDSVRPEEQFFISMAVSLAICDLTDKYLFGIAKIKWPNDIYLKDDKIAGILIENSLAGNNIESCIAGIGINLNQEDFPVSVKNPSSLKIWTGKETDREEFLQHFMRCLDRRYKELLYGDRTLLHREYTERLYRINEKHRFSSAGERFTGIIKDVSLSGQLIIEDENGISREFSFKEVEFIS